jgi:hypothetical protein
MNSLFLSLNFLTHDFTIINSKTLTNKKKGIKWNEMNNTNHQFKISQYNSLFVQIHNNLELSEENQIGDEYKKEMKL